MNVHQIGRYLFPADDDDLRRFTVERLVVPYRLIDRIAARMPDAVRGRVASPEARVKRAADSNAVSTLRDVLSGEHSVLSHVRGPSIDPERWILALDNPASSRQQLMAVLFDGHTTPEAVVKIRMSARGAADLANEREALTSAARLPDRVRSSIPRLLGWSETDGRAALLASWVGGRSVYADLYAALLPRLFVRAHFRAAIDWLIEFQDASRMRDTVDLDEQLSAVGRTSMPPDVAEDVTDAVRQVRRLAPARTLRLAACHGDFWPRNIILRDHAGAAGIVDWERYSPRCSPFDDLFHFPVTYGLAYPWYGVSEEAVMWSRTFLERNHVSRSVRRFLGRYCLRRGLPPGLLLPLLRLHLLNRHRDAQARGETIGNTGDTVWMQGLRALAQATDSQLSG